MDASEAMEEMLATDEILTSETTVMEVEQTEHLSGTFFLVYHKVKSMDLHNFDSFFSQTGQANLTDGGSSESLMEGAQCHQPIEIGQGQFKSVFCQNRTFTTLPL